MKHCVRCIGILIFIVQPIFATQPPKRPLSPAQMQEEAPAHKQKTDFAFVTLESNDGKQFTIQYDQDNKLPAPANIMETVHHLISDIGADQVILIPALNATMLGLIVDLAQKISNELIKIQNELDEQNRIKLEKDTNETIEKYLSDTKIVLVKQKEASVDLIDLILAANYLDFKYLLNLLIPLIAQKIFDEENLDQLKHVFERLRILPMDIAMPILDQLMIQSNITLVGITNNFTKIIQEYIGSMTVDPNDKFLICEELLRPNFFMVTLPELTIKKISLRDSRFLIKRKFISPDGKRLAVTLNDNRNILIYNTDQIEINPIGLKVPLKISWDIRWSPSGRYLVVPTQQGVLVYDSNDLTQAPLVLRSSNPIRHMFETYFINENTIIGKQIPGGTLGVYTIAESNFSLESNIEIPAHGYFLQDISSKGFAVFLRTPDNWLGVINMNTIPKNEQTEFKDFFGACPLNYSIRGPFSFDGSLAVVSRFNGNGNNVYFWNLIKNSIIPLQITVLRSEMEQHVALSKNNKFLMIAQNQTLTIYAVGTEKRKKISLPSQLKIEQMIISADSSFLLIKTPQEILYQELFPNLAKKLTFLESLLVIKLKQLGKGVLQNDYFKKFWNDRGSEKQEMITKYLAW